MTIFGEVNGRPDKDGRHAECHFSPTIHRILCRRSIASRFSSLPVACLGFFAAPSAFAAARSGEPVAGSVAQLILGLLVVLGAIFAGAWLFRRMGGLPGSAQGVVKIIAGVPMGARERIVLVQVGETQLLVGVAPGRIQTLHVLPEPVTPPPSDSGTSFSARLAAALNQRRPS